MKLRVSRYVADRITRSRDDFKVEFTCGSGDGGQNRNRRHTAVRITDLRTGITVWCCDERKQLQNRNRAFGRLVLRLAEHYRSEEISQRVDARTEMREVRVYKQPRNLVIDHRVKGRTFSYPEVLDGHLEPVITAVLQSAVGGPDAPLL